MEDQQVREHVARTESLLMQLETLPDPTARQLALEAVQSLLALYGEGLARMVAIMVKADVTPQSVIEDELLAHLLLLHGLHPHDVETRVRAALRAAQRELSAQGGDLQLLGVEGHVVRLRLVKQARGGCGGGASSAASLRETVERALLDAAPEIRRVEIEGEAHTPLTTDGGFIPLGNLIAVDDGAG